MAESKMATLADFRDAGRTDGEFLSDMFTKYLIERYGDAVPEGAVDLFNAWSVDEMRKCEARLRAAGANDKEVSAWRNALVAAVRKSNETKIRALKKDVRE
jgi:hypothetical protein